MKQVMKRGKKSVLNPFFSLNLLHIEVTEYCSEIVTELWEKSEISFVDLTFQTQNNLTPLGVVGGFFTSPSYQRPESTELSWDNS